LPVHYGVIALGTLAIARGWLPLPLQLLVSLLIGASFAGLTFVAHEALHGGLVRSRRLRRVVGRLGFLPFAVPPQLWEAWHNRVHHGNTNRSGIDPDAYPSLAEYDNNRALRRVTDWLAPGRSRFAGVFSLLVGFSVQSLHMLLTARRRQFLTASAHRRALLEAGIAWTLCGVLAVALGPAAFALAFCLPLVVGNAIIMSFILTNHTLSPHTKINDPLVNSLSVVVPRFFQWLTLGFGFHVEHHLFPAMSGRYARELRLEVRRRFPDRYQSLPHWRALVMLYRSPRVYRTDTQLFDPVRGHTWPTLVPSGGGAPLAVLENARLSDEGRPPLQPATPHEAHAAHNLATRSTALALSLTASIACAAPPPRTPDADEPRAPRPESQLVSQPATRPADAGDPIDAHHAPPATTSMSPPASGQPSR
jgi:fatty acid desaturase